MTDPTPTTSIPTIPRPVVTVLGSTRVDLASLTLLVIGIISGLCSLRLASHEGPALLGLFLPSGAAICIGAFNLTTRVVPRPGDAGYPALPLRRVLADTADVAEFMRTFGHEIRETPTADIPDDERALWVRLVIEEAVEFADAMGCRVGVDNGDIGQRVTKDTVHVRADPTRSIDLVEATDALGDIIVVTKGSALTIGAPVDAAVEIIHGTNMAKAGPDGKPIRRADGKVTQPDGWQPPTESLRALLIEYGWNGSTPVPSNAPTDLGHVSDTYCDGY